MISTHNTNDKYKVRSRALPFTKCSGTFIAARENVFKITIVMVADRIACARDGAYGISLVAQRVRAATKRCAIVNYI